MVEVTLTAQQKRIACPIIDQHGKLVGVHHALPEELLYVEAYVDERGTVWTPPTAWAYMRSQQVLQETREELAKARGEVA